MSKEEDKSIVKKRYDVESEFSDLHGIYIINTDSDNFKTCDFYISNYAQDVDKMIQNKDLTDEKELKDISDFSGFIKWDGCSEIYGQTHICHLDMFDNFTNMYKTIYKQALAIIEI